MDSAMVNLSIPFEVLIKAVKMLDLPEKERLFLLLEAEIAAAEEAMVDENDLQHSEILEARSAYHAGDYLTLDEYVARQDRND